jgi:hypothetical protein
MRTKTKKKKTTNYSEPKSKQKPQVPKEVLYNFLEDKIKISQVRNIKDVKCEFLWDRDGLQRYRINIWQEEYTDGQYCSRFFIGYSWFVHYCTRTKEITDKTIQPRQEI